MCPNLKYFLFVFMIKEGRVTKLKKYISYCGPICDRERGCVTERQRWKKDK